MALSSAFVQRLSGLFIESHCASLLVNFPHFLFANFLPFIFCWILVPNSASNFLIFFSSAFHLLVFCPYFLGHFLNCIFQSFYQTKFCIQSYFSFSGNFLAPCMFCSSNNLVLSHEDKPQITPQRRNAKETDEQGTKGIFKKYDTPQTRKNCLDALSPIYYLERQ